MGFSGEKHARVMLTERRNAPQTPRMAGERSGLTPVVQQDRTGCAVASVAAVTGEAYSVVKKAAEDIGIVITNSKLWTDSEQIRRLLQAFEVVAGKERAFTSWETLPDCALLAIKWHRTKTGPAWHWVVFVRDASGEYVLDSKRGLRSNRRTDFGRMKPRWSIELRRRPLRPHRPKWS